MKLRLWLTYAVMCFAGLRELAKAVNEAGNPDELDEIVKSSSGLF